MKYFTILLCTHLSFQLTAQTMAELYQKKDTALLRAFQKKNDRFFLDDWIFKSLEHAFIDAGEYYFLNWTTSRNGLTVERSYAYNRVSKPAFVHEQRFRNVTLICQGYGYFSRDTLKYFGLAYLKEPYHRSDVYGAENYQVDFYTFEIFDQGTTCCIYKTKRRNHYEMLFEEKITDKIELMSGDDCLDIIR